MIPGAAVFAKQARELGESTTKAARDAAAEWTTMTADALVDHIEATHHRYLWDELPRITTLVDTIVSARYWDRVPAMIRDDAMPSTAAGLSP